MSHASSCCDKIPGKKQLKEEGFLLAPRCRHTFHQGVKSRVVKGQLLPWHSQLESKLQPGGGGAHL